MDLRSINKYLEQEVRKDNKMQSILSELNNTYWKDVVSKHFEVDNPWLHKIITYSTRGDYVYLSKANPESTISLDLGAGWGQSLDALSQVSKKVWALEGTIDKLHFIQKRIKQDGLNNVELINATALDMPFSDNTFDLIVMNGVLEWIPVSDITKNPRELQILALKECLRILRPGGQLIVGIENSHGLKYFYGEPDDHTGVVGISYLSRKKATEKLKEVRNEEYRTYTYTMKGYSKLLQESGFNNRKIEFYYPVPSYKIFSFILPIKNIKSLKYIYSNLQPNLLQTDIDRRVIDAELALLKEGKINKLKNRVSSYFIVSSK